MEKRKILIIDDEEILTRTLVKLLTKTGYDAFFVKCGEDAIEIVKDVDFDLIISDIRMPGKNGYETLEGIREVCSALQKKYPPAIVITGYADESLEKQIKQLSPAAFLYKPFDINELLAHIQRLSSGIA